MKVSVVNSTDSSFCWNYVTDTFYGNNAGNNVCCIYAGFEVHSVTGMLMNLFVAIMKETVSVALMQLEVSAAHMNVTVSVANMWVTIFHVIMQMGVSVEIMQVRRYVLQYIMHMTVFNVIMQVTLSFIAI